MRCASVISQLRRSERAAGCVALLAQERLDRGRGGRIREPALQAGGLQVGVERVAAQGLAVGRGARLGGARGAAA